MTDDQTFAEIQQIKAELRDHGGMLRSLLYAQAGHLAEEICTQMRADVVLARVFLLVDGVRTQRDIVTLLITEGTRGASQPNVSRKMARLAEFGLIAPIGRGAVGGTVYQTTPSADALRIRRAAEAIVKGAQAAGE